MSERNDDTSRGAEDSLSYLSSSEDSAPAGSTPPVSRRAAREARELALASNVSSSPATSRPTFEDLFEPTTESPTVVAATKRRRRRGCLIALLVVLAIIGGIVAGGAYLWNTYNDQIRGFFGATEPVDWEPGEATGEVFVTVSPGDTGEVISHSLYEAQVTRTERVFYNYIIAERLDPTFYPGIYRLQLKMTAAAALDAMEDPANRIDNSVSVGEGRTLTSLLPSIAETLGFSDEEMQAAVADPAAYGVAAPSLEGWLFPKVYEFEADVTPQQVVQQMVDHTREALGAAGVPAGDEQRVLTIASIIQREGRFDDFDKVSRVIQNRLDIDMMLQMDSTAQFGAGELEAGSVSTSAHAQYNDNPWNTYVIQGLPITPISTVSEAAIRAAMNPADGPWLYFVTVNPESGETVFTSTYEEHLEGVRQWGEWCNAHGNPSSGCAGS